METQPGKPMLDFMAQILELTPEEMIKNLKKMGEQNLECLPSEEHIASNYALIIPGEENGS